MKALDFDALRDATWPDQRERFERLLEADAAVASAALVAAVRHQVLTGGKRIRATLPVAVCRALGGDGEALEAAAWLGLGLELVHSATLCHDDLMDGDEVRRDRPTVWVRFGSAQAINAGDLLFYLGDAAVARAGGVAGAARDRLGAAVRAVIHGQGLELDLRSRGALPTPEDYRAIARGKTGQLFGASFSFGALTAGASLAQVDAVAALGLDLGCWFQVLDDLIDLLGDKGRGATGNDLREGKPSWLVAQAAGGLDAAARDRFAAALYRPRAEKGPGDVAALRACLDDAGAIEAGLRLREREPARIRAQVAAQIPSLGPIVEGLLLVFERPLVAGAPGTAR